MKFATFKDLPISRNLFPNAFNFEDWVLTPARYIPSWDGVWNLSLEILTMGTDFMPDGDLLKLINVHASEMVHIKALKISVKLLERGTEQKAILGIF